MKKVLFVQIVIVVVLFSACSGVGSPGGGSTEITVAVDGKESKFTPSSSWAYHSTKTFSEQVDGENKMTKSSITTIVLANFELDSKQAFISLGKQKLDKPEQFKVMFGFTGAEETTVDTPIKSGDYTAEAVKYSKLETPKIYYFADGEEKAVEFEKNTFKGKLTITGVSGTTITGTIDATDGKNTLKGSFSANGHKSVK